MYYLYIAVQKGFEQNNIAITEATEISFGNVNYMKIRMKI